MTVRELMERLQKENPDNDVRFQMRVSPTESKVMSVDSVGSIRNIPQWTVLKSCF